MGSEFEKAVDVFGVVERVVDAYDVSLDVAAEDVRNFLLQMKELEVVK